jgi:hypothetical protein
MYLDHGYAVSTKITSYRLTVVSGTNSLIFQLVLSFNNCSALQKMIYAQMEKQPDRIEFFKRSCLKNSRLLWKQKFQYCVPNNRPLNLNIPWKILTGLSIQNLFKICPSRSPRRLAYGRTVSWNWIWDSLLVAVNYGKCLRPDFNFSSSSSPGRWVFTWIPARCWGTIPSTSSLPSEVLQWVIYPRVWSCWFKHKLHQQMSPARHSSTSSQWHIPTLKGLVQNLKCSVVSHLSGGPDFEFVLNTMKSLFLTLFQN